jgi:predicted transposase YdaD
MVFDATLKDLAALDPRQFLAGVDAAPTLPVCVLTVDLSTVTASTDIVFGLGDPLQEVVQVDVQSGPDASKHRDLLAYHALLHRHYRVPVHSILLFLRRQAQLSTQEGNIAYAPRPGRGKMDFGYEVVAMWERPVEAWLAGGLPLLPLTPLCRMPDGMTVEDGARWAVLRMVERLEREAAPEVTRRLKTAALILSGLRFRKPQVAALFAGVAGMRESEGYQLILDEGRDEGLILGVQRTILHQGRTKFGEPDDATRTALARVTDIDRLDRLSERLLHASTWDELLQTP